MVCSCVPLGSEKAWHVLQDLEIYIGKQKVEDGYALVARAGRVVQVSRPCRSGVPCSKSLHCAAVCEHAIIWAAAQRQHVDFIYCITLAMCTVGTSPLLLLCAGSGGEDRVGPSRTESSHAACSQTPGVMYGRGICDNVG